MLAPAEDIPEYQQAYVEGLPDSTIKELMIEEDEEVFITDQGSIPDATDYGDKEASDSETPNEDDNNATLLGGPGTPITPMGPSYYTQQAVAVQITGLNTGR